MPDAQTRKPVPDRARPSSFGEACLALEDALAGDLRRDLLAEVSKAKTFDRSARYLRDGMRAHRFEAPGRTGFHGSWVRAFDRLTREDGFHALNDWDGKADRFNDDIIPVEVANFAERILQPADPLARERALAILLDYYFLHLLALAALRAWDEGDPNANLDVIGRLLGLLQGPKGSGQKFAEHPLGLILIATSHFEPDVSAYDRLLRRIQALDRRHLVDLAITHAGILGCHLRFGLEVTCAGNLSALRDDNVPDYPWLGQALATLLAAYAGSATVPRKQVTEALLLGLMPDPEAFLGPRPPESLAEWAGPREQIRDLFAAHRADLMRDFAELRPDPKSYSPFAFTFNFPHNLLKGIVVDAAARGRPWPLSVDGLLTAIPPEESRQAQRLALATTLMKYALLSPDTIRGRPHPAIVYHPAAGQEAYERIITTLGRL